MRRFRAILVGLMAVLAAGPAGADYSPPMLYELAGTADHVVIGTISAVHEETFELAVEQALVGPLPTMPLLVKRFRNWTCASRWKPYEVGQHVLAFLQRVPGDGKMGDSLRLMSAGSQGEWEILDGLVRVPYYIHGAKSDEQRKHLVPLEQVSDAFSRFASCFSVKEREILQTCSEEALAAFRARSIFHEELVKTSLRMREFWAQVLQSDPAGKRN